MTLMIYAVGLGPGAWSLVTPQAQKVLEECDVIAGYHKYLALLPENLQAKCRIAGGMTAEIARCTAALEATLNGEQVVMVSSGDAGVYGMAGLLLELTCEGRFAGIEVVVIPGITAALSAAALVGAPFMNDFAIVSLSDLMTPQEVIRKRLELLAQADMPVALYNPASSKRRELLDYAIKCFSAYGDWPAAVVSDAYRSEQHIWVGTLTEFPANEVHMTSIVLIGNSQTRNVRNHLYAKRGYQEKYGFGE